jgi:Sec-independent protein translocase protein TatA
LDTPNIGPAELWLVAVIAPLVLGRKRLPAAGRLGHGIRELRVAIEARAGAELDAAPERPARTQERVAAEVS